MVCNSVNASEPFPFIMGLLDQSVQLYDAISESFGEDSAEMTEFLGALNDMGALVGNASERPRILLNAVEWVSIIGELAEDKKKGLLAFGVLPGLIDAHTVMAEHVWGRRSHRRLAFDRIKPRPKLVRALACHEFADWYLRTFTDSCMRQGIDENAADADFSSPFFPVRSVAPASSALAVSYSSDACAPHLEVDSGEPMEVDSGCASSACSMCDDHDYRGGQLDMEAFGSAFPEFDGQLRLDGDGDYLMSDDIWH